jgi:hypothetical protein
MENPCYCRGRKSFPLLCYCICILNKPPCISLDIDCYRVRMLSGYLDCAQAYSSTTAVILTWIQIGRPVTGNYMKLTKQFIDLYDPLFDKYCPSVTRSCA